MTQGLEYIFLSNALLHYTNHCKFGKEWKLNKKIHHQLWKDLTDFGILDYYDWTKAGFEKAGIFNSGK